MAKKEEMEVEISPSGEVKIHMKGIKGKKCLNYVPVLEEIVGRIKQKILTTEYYEPEPKAKIHIEEEGKG